MVATNQNTGSGSTHNEIQPSITKLSAIRYRAPTASGLPVATGTSVSGYWTAVPSGGYIPEDGAAVSRTTYSALFAVIGTTYGAGDGSTTFNLPDSRGRIGVNRSTTDAEFDTMGEKTGTKTEALTVAQLPLHNHVQNPHSHSVSDPGHNHTQNPHTHEGRSSPNGDYIGMAGGTQGGWAIANAGNNAIFRMVTTDTVATNVGAYTNMGLTATTSTNQSTGSGAAHNNIQPSIVKLFVIKY